MVKNSVGNLVKEKRKELGLTQAQLAERIGSDEYYISSIETGKRIPGNKFLLSISNTLNIPTDSLLGIESNVVLHNTVSELEAKLQKLTAADREMVLDITEQLIDRLTPKE